MTPATYNVVVRAGETMEDVSWSFDDDVTGLAARIEVWTAKGGTMVTSLSTADGTLDNNGVAGYSPHESYRAPDSPGVYEYELWVNDGVGKHPRVVGTWTIVKTIMGAFP